MRHDNRANVLTVLISTLSVPVVVSPPVFGEDGCGRVLERYPTRGQLQLRVDETKALHQAAYEAAKRDFDEAIWKRRVLVGPPRPGPPLPRPVMSPRPTLTALWSRREWQRVISDTEALEGGAALGQFYRDHIDEFTIDESSPVLKEVLIDVLLNGWEDWTHWDDKKLVALREAFPELHRVYAIRELRRLKVEDVGGVLLELLTEPNIVPDLLTVSEAVVDLVDPKDAFPFVLDVYLKSNNPIIRDRMERSLPGFSARAGKDETVKELWRPFLESEIPLLQFEARIAFDLSVPDIFARYDLHQRWVAENDPDPARREEARKHVEARALRQQIRERQAQENR